MSTTRDEPPEVSSPQARDPIPAKGWPAPIAWTVVLVLMARVAYVATPSASNVSTVQLR